ncbi:hypothetical protein A3E49_01580 [Candidatus Saccharibacteria bacterium RIFCSPHIGHO2_12_FULL_49_19]|nr:MAG: hypothetical protein A3E49_01580 [Candidatus Saccharibacteria bacterium RIFCSPHIGHO2_12_FULL_49_19]
MLLAFLLISLLFIGGLIYNQKSRKRVCAICISVLLSWFVLFILYKTGAHENIVLLSLLMGQSITGLYYFGLKRLPKPLRIFTLPFFLSLTVVFYLLITEEFILTAFGLLTALWILAWLIFIYRDDPGKKPLAQAVTNCCEDV